MKFLPHFDPPGWSLAVLPDLQNYTRDQENIHVLHETLDWIAGPGRNLGIELVVQVGDLTNRNVKEEWVRVRKAFCKLDGVLPYVVAVGNHDLGKTGVGSSRFTRLNDYFQFVSQPQALSLLECFEEGRLENAVYQFRPSGQERCWRIFSLEFGPRKPVVSWAGQKLLETRDLPAIIVTHEYMDHLSLMETGRASPSTPETLNSPYSYDIAHHEGGVSCGKELWHSLVEPHSQVCLVVNGHYRPYERDINREIVPLNGVASASRTDRRSDGSSVHQHLINGQWAPRGGDGWLKLFRFNEAGELLRTDLVSPFLESTRLSRTC